MSGGGPCHHGRMRIMLLATILALAALLAGCVPGTQPGAEPEVIVINGPEGAQVDGVADAFVAQLEELGTPAFDVVRNVAIAGVEGRRNLSGSQAVRSAAEIARTFGARWTLMLGVDDLDREIFAAAGPNDLIVVELSVEAILVRGDDAEVVARIGSRTFSGERLVDEDADLPGELSDPLVRELARDAATSLVPVLREILASQVGETAQRK